MFETILVNPFLVFVVEPFERNPLAQSFGLLSFVLGVLAFSQKDDTKLKLYLGVLFLSQTCHFYLLGSLTSAAANCLSLIRTVLSVKFHGRSLGWLFIALNVLWGGYLLDHPIAVLPIIAACLGTYGLFFLSGIKMRLAFMTGAICWVINNIWLGSVGGVLLEVMVFTTNAITIFRLKRRPLES